MVSSPSRMSAEPPWYWYPRPNWSVSWVGPATNPGNEGGFERTSRTVRVASAYTPTSFNVYPDELDCELTDVFRSPTADSPAFCSSSLANGTFAKAVPAAGTKYRTRTIRTAVATALSES